MTDSSFLSTPTKRQLRQWQRHLSQITQYSTQCQFHTFPPHETISLPPYLSYRTPASATLRWCLIFYSKKNQTPSAWIREWVCPSTSNTLSTSIGLEIEVPWQKPQCVEAYFYRTGTYTETLLSQQNITKTSFAPHPLDYEVDWWCGGMLFPFQTLLQRQQWLQRLQRDQVFLPDDVHIQLSTRGCHLFLPYQTFAQCRGTRQPFEQKWLSTWEERQDEGERLKLYLDLVTQWVRLWESFYL